MKIQSYKELIVWQKSIQLVKEVYKLTSLFPRNEQFVIISQIHRAVISIPSNIAEGYARRSHKEYLQFYAIAYGSALELDTQLVISKELQLAPTESFSKSEELLLEVIKMLCVMVYREKGGISKRLVSSV
ncbi:four helix bundle protein [Candidatus Daviesbacteria bacterium]|nr:four helix bundle protein [Candidatus Daviesbacteria bacterium]